LKNLPPCDIPSRVVGVSPEPSARGSIVSDDAELFALVYRQMRGFAALSQDIDDLVQIALEQVVRGRPAFGGRAALSTWTHQICYRTWLKHRRWYGRWLRRFALTDDGALPERGGTPGDAVDALEERERATRLHSALEGIAPKRRAVVVLHDLQGRSIEEIAVIVEAPPLTVKSRLRDGRKLLTRALRDDPYFGEASARKEIER
jgi:RNA polymerase sigma-70 factor (ECF subfamily)